NSTVVDAPARLVHAVCWEEAGYAEADRYALLAIDKGAATLADLHDLNDFAVSPPYFPNEVSAKFNAEILKHPAFVDNGTQNSVDVIFGDTHINAFNRVTLKPVADGRIHIPIGVHPGGPRVPAPLSFSTEWNGRITTITSRDSMLLYNTTDDAVSYIMYSAGNWSSVKSVALSDKLSAD